MTDEYRFHGWQAWGPAGRPSRHLRIATLPAYQEPSLITIAPDGRITVLARFESAEAARFVAQFLDDVMDFDMKGERLD